MKKLLIFGDSYSTFAGEIPEGHTTYYPNNDVLQKEDTWWFKFIERSGYELVYNDSWSGSTISYTGYNNCDCSKTSSFICRYKKLRSDFLLGRKDIDLIIVLGGSNDSWADSPLGDTKLSDRNEKDLYNVLPAISYFIHSLKCDFPFAEILFVINNDIKKEIKDSIVLYSNYFGTKCIELHDIEKINSHPTSKGMTEICNQVLKEVSK